MIWRELTSKEFQTVDKSIPVLLPIGAVEQHGAHLNVETDILISEYFCNEVHKSLEQKVLILPSISVCASAHHMDFAGTLSVSHETLIKYIKEILLAVKTQGFKNLIIFNAHGGNQSLASVIVESFGIENPDCNIALITWWKLAIEELTKLNEGDFLSVGHACEFETSILQYIKPQSVRENEIQDGTVKHDFSWASGDLLRGSKVHLHKTMREYTQNGVFGKATLASQQKGKKIVELILSKLIPIIEDMKTLDKK